MADQIIHAPQIDATKAAAIAEKVQRELKFRAKLAGTVFDVSKYAKPGFKSVSFPKFSSFTVTNRASGTKGEAQSISSTIDTLNLEKNAFCSWIIDSMDELQSSVMWQADLAVRAAAAHGRFVDECILAELGLVAQDAPFEGGLTKDGIVELRKSMVETHVDPMECYLIVDTTEYANLLKIDDFISAEKYGVSALPSGVVGKVFGLNVIEHAGMEGFLCYHPEALALGFQAAPKLASQPAIEFGSSSERKVLDQLFGVKGLQILGSGKSALAFKKA